MSKTPRHRREGKLWVISELYYPEQTSTGYFLTEIAEGLADDFEVAVLCGQPSYSEKGVRASAIEHRNGTEIRRLRSTHFDKDRLLLRVVNFVTFTFAVLATGLLRFRRGDRILVVTNPPLAPLAVALAARLHGCRTYLLVHDIYPEVLSATGALSASSSSYRLLEAIFARTFRLYDTVVVLGRDMAQVVRDKIATATMEIVLIPNWGDVDEIAPLIREENSFAGKHGLADKFVVQFSGNIGRTHDVEVLLEAARQLRHRTDIMFVFVGYGGKSALVEQTHRTQGANLMFLPRQPREQLGAMLACSDLTVIPFIDGMLGLSVPSRMYNVMAAGVPILAVADPASELALTVAENNAGWVMPQSDASALVSLIAQLADDPTRRMTRQRGAAGRAAVVRRYTLPIVLDLYRDLFQRP